MPVSIMSHALNSFGRREGRCPRGMAEQLFKEMVSSPDESVACAALDTLCTLIGGSDGEPASGALAPGFRLFAWQLWLCVLLVGPLAQAECPASLQSSNADYVSSRACA